MVADLCQPVCHPAAKVGVVSVDGFPPWDIAGDDGWPLIPVAGAQQLFDLIPVARSQRLVRVAQVIEDQQRHIRHLLQGRLVALPCQLDPAQNLWPVTEHGAPPARGYQPP